MQCCLNISRQNSNSLSHIWPTPHAAINVRLTLITPRALFVASKPIHDHVQQMSTQL